MRIRLPNGMVVEDATEEFALKLLGKGESQQIVGRKICKNCKKWFYRGEDESEYSWNVRLFCSDRCKNAYKLRVKYYRGKENVTAESLVEEAKSVRRVRTTRKSIRQRLELIRAELVKGRELSSDDIRELGIEGDITYLVKTYLAPSKWAKVVKEGNRLIVMPTKRTSGGIKTVVRHRKPREPSEYNLFVGRRTKQLMAEGYTNRVAFGMAQKEWSGGKKRGASSFPVFESVRSDLVPILIPILERTVRHNVKIDFGGVSYALDLRTEADYRRFIDDILANAGEIRQFFGVKEGSFRYNGYSLSFS